MFENENANSKPDPGSGPHPVDTFKLIGNDIRTEIIQTLGYKSIQDRGYRELPFSELHELIDTDIDTSRLNYHLKQLVGHFVRKGADGYRLGSAGILLYRTIRAGQFDRREEQVSVDAGFDCYYCESPVEANFNRGFVKVTCHGCRSNFHVDTSLTASLEVFEDASTAFDHYGTFHQIRVIGWSYDICHICGNDMDSQLVPVADLDAGNERLHEVLAHLECDNCGSWVYLRVGQVLLTDPALVLFCYERGIDLFANPYWEYKFLATSEFVTVESTDPCEVSLQIPLDGETLEIVLAEDLTVIERNRLDISETVSTFVQNTDAGSDSSSDGSEASTGVVLPDQDVCMQVIREHRWSNGVTCPHCESTDTTKKGTTEKSAQRYRCHECDSIFNDLTGTVFAGQRFSLQEMVHIIQNKGEQPTTETARELDRSYQSVLDFVHKVQDASDGDPGFEFSNMDEPDEVPKSAEIERER